ncbi:MAG TPA: hypothetical protein VKL40_13370 [Candidatus Angelobacter sp.]|nr:hypothetical protein [Candidatus Angelobacter sp.]
MNSTTAKEVHVQPVVSVKHDVELVKWQKRLLPVMTLFVIVLAMAFFLLSTKTLNSVDSFVQAEHGELRDQINRLINQSKPADNADDSVRRGLLLLEADALDRRYHQASALLMSRIWAKHLAFMTGMIMAFIGAIFILGKLSESPSAISGGGSQWNVSVTSASPGIFLAFFGTTLVALSIVIHDNIDVHDGPAYLRSVILQNESSQGTKPSASTVDQSIMDKLKGLTEQPTPGSGTGRK